MSAAMTRRCGTLLILGGVSFALFMIVHPFGTVVGEVATRTSWVPAHTLHFLGALFSLGGLLGLYAYQKDELGALGPYTFAVAFIGMAMFVGTGMTTAFLWPAIAAADPAFVAAEGGMFTNPLASGMTTGTYVFLVLGFVLFGASSLRARVLPRGAVWMMIVGVVLFSAPVQPFGPAPWIARVIGAIVFGTSLVLLGRALRRVRQEAA